MSKHNSKSIKEKTDKKWKNDTSLAKKELGSIKEAALIMRKWDTKMQEHLVSLEEKIAQLQDEVFELRKLPQEVSKQIASISPAVASEVFAIVEHNLTDNFDQNVDVCNSKLQGMKDVVEDICSKIQSVQRSFLKQKIANALLMLFMSAVGAMGASYVMMKQFPQRVVIQSTGSVNVEDSRVSIWESKGEVKVKK